EGFVTLPFGGAYPLAICSHVFEFLDDDGKAHFADELKRGGEYRVVLTTGGGLYRYPLYDRVHVTGFVGQTPSLTFLGREDGVSDRRGEKLTAADLAAVLREGLPHDPANPLAFAMLAPDDADGVLSYTLYVQMRDATAPSAYLDMALAHRMDEA